MSYIIGGYIIFLIGLFIGALFNREETCPKVVMGYDCSGEYCDHRKSVLYTNMAIMAKNHEERERENERNLWGGQ